MNKVTTITIILIAAVILAFKTDETDHANKFLNSLNQEQLSKTQFTFDNGSKYDWHYLPVYVCVPEAASNYLRAITTRTGDIVIKIQRMV